jgi:hypothetical protein
VLENTGNTVKCVMIDKIVTDDTGIGNVKILKRLMQKVFVNRERFFKNIWI